MRWLIAGVITLLTVSLADAALLRPADVASTDAVLRWINGYRVKPDPKSVPAAMRALSRFGALSEPERAGVYLGFFAGILGSDPDTAEKTISESLSMRPDDYWIIVRAIAYSGLPNWKPLLREFAPRIPLRHAMIEKYLADELPTLGQLVIGPAKTSYDRFREHFKVELGTPARKDILEPSPEVLDILWGYYFATASSGPVFRLIDLLPWSADHDDLERLSIGSIAKYTLASNATHDQTLLAMLKGSSKARNQPVVTVTALNEVADAAETVNTARIRKEAMAAMDELRTKGPAYKRAVSWWGYVGQSVIAGGCIAAAVTGQVELGIPCVVGGATASAAFNFWANQP
jgi:hypothetical protein